MVTFETGDLSAVALIILIILYFNMRKRSEKASVSDKLFIALIITNMLMIVIDILGWVFNGLPGTHNLVFNVGFNFLLYMLAPVAIIIWALYLHYQIHKDKARLKKIWRGLLAVFLLNAAATIATLFTGWFFSVSENNIYQRGSFFWLHVALCYALFIGTFVYTLINRRKIEKRQFYSLLSFYALPFAGTVIQVFSYGVSYNWIGIMLSILIIYIKIQNRGLNTDYLTGAYNRRQFDGYVKAKLHSTGDGHAFSAIMLDLDGFKNINDSFGHGIGDEALKDAVKIIKNSMRENDFVARIGGDEFIVILDIDAQKPLEDAVSRIEHNVREFNSHHKRPYSISFSYGYGVFNARSETELHYFFRRIDRYMYENKSLKREAAI